MLSALRVRSLPTLKRAFFSTEIPVDHVARIVRFHVGDEATALVADTAVSKAVGKLRDANLNGAVSFTRTVCKAEWEYEIELVFTRAGFGAYMESDFREQEMQPILEEMRELATNDNVYEGNRVWNRYEL